MSVRNELLSDILTAIQTGGSTEAQIQEITKGVNGYGFYANSTATELSPLVVSDSSTVALIFDTATRETRLPDGYTTMFSGGRIVSNDVDGMFDVRVGFWAAPSNNNGAFGINIDISAAGDGSIVIAEDARRMVRGSNTYQFYTIPLPVFSAETFVNNGGLVRFSAIDGDISLYGIQLLVSKVG